MGGADALDGEMEVQRQRIGKRWKKIADDAGITPQHLSRIRKGQSPLNAFTAAQIDRALEWPHGHAWATYTDERDDAREPDLQDETERYIWSMDAVPEDLRREYIAEWRAKKSRRDTGRRETG